MHFKAAYDRFEVAWSCEYYRPVADIRVWHSNRRARCLPISLILHAWQVHGLSGLHSDKMNVDLIPIGTVISMEHNISLITTISAGFGAALVFGFIAEKN